MKIGIQGGIGSFNEEAVNKYIKNNNLTDVEIVYLYTTDAVLKALQNNQIDFGQFAIHNSTGGVVWESVLAMGKYNFKVNQQFAIKISHHLMCKKHLDINDINTIKSHPQVLKQCVDTLKKDYGNFKLTSGKGVYIDTARVAKDIEDDILPNNIATLGSKMMADVYNLKILKSNLQDNKNNWTYFLIVAN